jgi:hypothetical protein
MSLLDRDVDRPASVVILTIEEVQSVVGGFCISKGMLRRFSLSDYLMEPAG